MTTTGMYAVALGILIFFSLGMWFGRMEGSFIVKFRSKQWIEKKYGEEESKEYEEYINGNEFL